MLPKDGSLTEVGNWRPIAILPRHFPPCAGKGKGKGKDDGLKGKGKGKKGPGLAAFSAVRGASATRSVQFGTGKFRR